MKNHFFIAYFGNKRQEVESLYNLINLDNIKTIVEPFCGSCAFSYYLSLLHPKKFKYILNDNNKNLVELLSIMKDEKKIIEFENKVNNYINDLNNLKVEKERRALYKKIVKTDDIYGFFISRKFYSIHYGLFNNVKTKEDELKDYKKFAFKDYPIYNFFKNEDIELNNTDAITVYNNYKSDKSALIFLDPPYIALTNSFYNSGNVDKTNKLNIYEYLYLNNINKEKAKIFLILEDMWINRLIFKNDIKETNDKYYECSKRTTKHITISNTKNI
jgi:16S rRNA G966 N2-methylase RsmD